MAKSGRPKQTPELNQARATSAATRRRLLQEIKKQSLTRINSLSRSYLAACLLYTLEMGTRFQRAQCEAQINELRKIARKHGPKGPWLSDYDFLDEFIQSHAPDWDWRKAITDGKPAARDKRLEDEWAWLDRQERARSERFVTADNPDLGCLHDLERSLPTLTLKDPTTWPTLRLLKLATAIPERRIKEIAASLEPEEGEIATPKRRHLFSKRGAFPKRYGPRLVYEVLTEFVRRLPTYSMVDAERERARKLAVRVKRSLAGKMGADRSST